MLAKAAKVVIAVISVVHISACSTSRGLVNYDTIDSSFQVTPGSISGGQAVGNVYGDEGGAVWNDCTDKAAQSVRVMVANAKDMGANAIGDIKWEASGNSTPTCKKGWGYVLLWPFLLTPLFMSTRVDATAYKTGAAMKKAGVFQIPADQAGQEQLVQQILAGN